MNVETFLRHHQIRESPFRAEEARQDAVFTRIETICHHPDYAKIRGEFDRPSSAIVFGERGSGKTAMRLQIEHELREHNRNHPEKRCLLIAYDDLNPVLDRFHLQMGEATAAASIERFRLVDHLDGMLSTIVPRLMDQLLNESRDEPVIEAEPSLRKVWRQSDAATKRDVLLLQSCYDRPEEADLRTSRVRRALRTGTLSLMPWMKWAAVGLGGLTIALALLVLIRNPEEQRWLWLAALVVFAVLSLFTGGQYLRRSWQMHSIARTLAKSLRTLHRPAMSFRKSLCTLPVHDVLTSELPNDTGDDARYHMVQRLLHALRPLGYRSMIVIVDRIDEPTLVNGEPERMRAIIWPLMNNKFLQQDQIGIKLLLPLDLKHELFRERTDFFREARLDKQNLVERLTWSGAMLYDICTTRLNACREEGVEPMSLRELFDETVTHGDLVDALDQMQQPRDAFKLMYAVIQEHCSSLPEETPQWQIPKLTLDTVRKQQVERLGGMLRGVRPA